MIVISFLQPPIAAISGDLAHIHYRDEVRVSGLLLQPGFRAIAVAATIKHDDAGEAAFTYRQHLKGVFFFDAAG